MSSQAVPQPGALVDEEQVCELLLIRHGRSADVVPGSDESLDPPLHEWATSQAEALARRLDGKDIAAIYASDLARAVQTAGYLAASRDLDVQQRQDLREVWLGEWERGEFRRRAQARDPEWLAFARSGPVGPRARLRGRRRAADARVGTRDRRDRGAAIAARRSRSSSTAGSSTRTWPRRSRLQPSWFALIENTSVTVVLAGAERRILVVVNDCSHLYDPRGAAPGPLAP